jgi:hypothetical protein
MGRPRRLFGLQQILCEPFRHLLLQQEFIHDERSASRTSSGAILEYEGLHQPSVLLLVAG